MRFLFIALCLFALPAYAQVQEIDAGGGLSNVVEDTTPQAGGDFDLNANDITGTGNILIDGVVEALSKISSLITDSSYTLTDADCDANWLRFSSSVNQTLIVPTGMPAGCNVGWLNEGNAILSVSAGSGLGFLDDDLIQYSSVATSRSGALIATTTSIIEVVAGTAP